MFRVFRLFVIAFALLLALPLRAQDNARDETARNPVALAARLLGANGEPSVPLPSPVYKPGDTAEFWVSKTGGDRPVKITAELAAATRDLYVWVEKGAAYDRQNMSQFAAQLDISLILLRVQQNYGRLDVVPRSAAEVSGLDLMYLPDVDNDEHISILYVKDMAGNAITLYNPNNSLPVDQAPGGYSSEREVVLVNLSAFPNAQPSDGAYLSLLIRQFYQMVALYNRPAQPPWLRDSLSWYMLSLLQQQPLNADQVTPFLGSPEVSLMQPASTDAGFGAGQLFLSYFTQRFGLSALRDVFTEPGKGLAPLNATLKKRGFTDPVTGDPVTAEDVFADFVVANAINAPVGDGRFMHTALRLGQGQYANAPLVRDQFDGTISDLSVNQFGTRYLALTATKDARFSLTFVGQETTPRLPLPEGSTRFYWSGDGQNRDTHMTRAFDLSGVSRATLTFDAWHVLAEDWAYGYVEASEDNGATWKILPATSTTGSNRYGAAYGPGFTGISSTEKPRPAAYLGVALGADGITIQEVTPDGPLSSVKDVLAGDVIAGHDGKPWQGAPDLIGWLGTHQPGDTVKLLMQRGQKTFEVSVTLGRHPTRVIQPLPVWVKQTVDLSAYAGKSILLRFEYISLPERANLGFAVDNIAIPEIGFQDDAEGGVGGWTLNGWQQMANETRQHYLVQVASVGTKAGQNSVQRLIGPADSASSGQWTFSISANQVMVFAVSGMNEDTVQPASFTLVLRSQTPQAEATAAPASS
jgi:hypothetical protein